MNTPKKEYKKEKKEKYHKRKRRRYHRKKTKRHQKKDPDRYQERERHDDGRREYEGRYAGRDEERKKHEGRDKGRKKHEKMENGELWYEGGNERWRESEGRRDEGRRGNAEGRFADNAEEGPWEWEYFYEDAPNGADNECACCGVIRFRGVIGCRPSNDVGRQTKIPTVSVGIF